MPVISASRPDLMQVVGDERVRREIQRVGAAEDEPEPPDQARCASPATICALTEIVIAGRGASDATMTTAMIATGIAHTTKLARQLPPTIGNTSGMVSAIGRTSPISKPLV